MLINSFNFLVTSGVGKDIGIGSLVNHVIADIEASEFEKFPRQSEVVGLFRDAGWGKKETVSKDLKHTIDGILEGVGLCVYFGHSGAAFQKLMAMQSMFLGGKVTECYFITQSYEMAAARNLHVNPKAKPGATGNRITFEEISLAMDHYHRFIKVPLTIIGMEILESQLMGREL